MSTHVVPDTCSSCGREFDDGEQAYYVAPCKLVKYGRGGYDGVPGIGRGAGEDELRVVFPGGRRKDRTAICHLCYSVLLGPRSSRLSAQVEVTT